MTGKGSARKGMSIMELLVGVVILAVVGMSLTRIMVAQARYFDHQKTSNKARNVSRGPLNRVVSDIRMVEAQGGISIASPTLIRARVPFGIGVVCVTGAGGTHLSLLPSDSAMYAAPGYSGYAWRDGQGIYHYRVGGNVKDEQGDLTACNAAGVGTLVSSKGKVIRITPKMSDTASIGTPVFLIRRVEYEFKASTAVPGTTGLYRRVIDDNGAEEELSAPYSSEAKFRFFVGNSLTAQDNPPADLSTLRGIELNMTGLSEKIPRQGLERQKAPFVTAVFFKNRLN